MSYHAKIPQISVATVANTIADLAKAGRAAVFWADVNDASRLCGASGIRNHLVPNGDPKVTAELDAWLARLVDHAPDRLSLLATGGDEVLIVDDTIDWWVSPRSEVVRLLLATQRPGFTVACGGIEATKGADGQTVMRQLTNGLRRAKTLGKARNQDVRTVVCWAQDGETWEDYVLPAPTGNAPEEARHGPD